MGLEIKLFTDDNEEIKLPETYDDEREIVRPIRIKSEEVSEVDLGLGSGAVSTENDIFDEPDEDVYQLDDDVLLSDMGGVNGTDGLFDLIGGDDNDMFGDDDDGIDLKEIMGASEVMEDENTEDLLHSTFDDDEEI